MADLQRERILQRLAANLAAITGPNYSMADHKTTRVVRVKSVDDERLIKNGLAQVIAIAASGDENHSEGAAGKLDAQMEVFVLLLRRHGDSTSNPFDIPSETPTEELVVNRLVQDFLTALWADPSLNGLARNIVAADGPGITISRAFDQQGWAVAEASFRIDYDYLAGTP